MQSLRHPRQEIPGQSRTAAAASSHSQTPSVGQEFYSSLIVRYHEQALLQASIHFWLGIAAAAVGLAWMVYVGASTGLSASVSPATMLAGALINSTALVLFRQATAARHRATDLYDRLREDVLTQQSIALVSSIENANLNDSNKVKISQQVIARSVSALRTSRK